MKITPLEIQHKVFPKQFRGYHIAQVNYFLDEIAGTLESLMRENTVLREKASSREEDMGSIRKAESALTNTIIASQNFADQLKEQAQQEADRILKESELKREEILLQTKNELTDLRQNLDDLRQQRALALERMRSTIEAFERILEGEEEGASPAELMDLQAGQTDQPSPTDT